MSSETASAFPQDRARKAPELESTTAPGVDDVPADDLVQRAFAILAEEKERWQAARPADLPPRNAP